MSAEDRILALENRVALLAKELMVARDEQAITKLNHIYGYYLDRCLYEEVIALFAEDCEVRLLRGFYKGKAGARRLFVDVFQQHFNGYVRGPAYGLLVDHMQMQEVVTVGE